ncbi:MAG: oligosaccharide flippase family protein [Verrucomicrobiota bacterium]
MSGPPTASNGTHRRNHAIRWAVITSLMSKAGTALLQLISIPIAIRVLGLEVFGIYSTIAMGILIVMLLQVGVGPALTHGISQALARNSRTDQQNYYTTAFFIILGLATLGVTIVSSILTTIPIPVLFGAKYAPFADTMRPALWLGLGIVIAQFILSHTERTREGYLEANINNAWGAAGNFLGAAALAVGISHFPSIEYLLLCVFGSNALAKLGNTIHLLIQRPWLFPRPRLFRRSIARHLLSDGVAFSLSSSVTGLVEFNACALIIGHLAGPATVGIFNVIVQIDVTLAGFVIMITTPTWPAIVDAVARHDLKWIQAAATKLRRFGAAYCVAAMIGIVTLGPWLIPLWLGPEVQIPRLTLFAFMCFFSIGIWNHIHHSLLIGMGKVKPAAVFVLAEALVILGPATLGLTQFGLPGLLLGMGLTKLAITGTVFPRMFRKSVHQIQPSRDKSNPSDAPLATNPSASTT